MGPILICTDGSEGATGAISAAMELLRPDAELVVVSVVDAPDPTLVSGTGFAGGTKTPEEYDAFNEGRLQAAQTAVEEAAALLGRPAATEVLSGDAGPAICRLAEERGAAGIVMGSRGRGGVKRALLGSVSDFVVRNATCPVVVTAAG